MGRVLVDLMATMLFPTLIIYWAGISLVGKNLTTASKVVGFCIALPSAAIAALIFTPSSSGASAESMFWPGSAAGAIIGAAIILGIGKRKGTDGSPNSNV